MQGITIYGIIINFRYNNTIVVLLTRFFPYEKSRKRIM